MTINIGTRIILGFLVVLALMTSLAIYQLSAMSTLRSSSKEIMESNLGAAKLLEHIATAQQAMRVYTERAIGLHFLESAGIRTESSVVAQQHWDLERVATLQGIDRLISLARERAAVAQAEQSAERWTEIAEGAAEARTKVEENAQLVGAVFDAVNAERLDALANRLAVLDENRAQFGEAMEALRDHTDQMAHDAKIAVEAIYANVRRIFMIGLAAAIVVTLYAIWILHRSIAPPLSEIVSFVERVGHGDLTQRVRDFGSDEMGRLGRQINQMINNLSETTKQTIAAVSNVSGATSQLEASAAQQAASANQQRTAVQEITTTLSEIAQSGNQISERAKEVAASSEMTLTASQEGLDAVEETRGIIGRIGEQSETVATNILALTEKTRSIGDITTSVNDIAERSDLLALNAAIEASAAGEHGRSFSVVADEMKNLAGQAKAATEQVQALLGDIQQGINTCVMQTEESVKRTELGKQQSEKLKDSIERLAESINVNVQAFEQIIAGTNQQQIGIEQVTQAVNEISSASGEVAEGTQGLQGAASSLNALSDQLRKSVQGYVVA